MDRLFNPDNPFWLGMGKIFDIFVLNVLWLLCCIPVVLYPMGRIPAIDIWQPR